MRPTISYQSCDIKPPCSSSIPGKLAWPGDCFTSGLDFLSSHRQIYHISYFLQHISCIIYDTLYIIYLLWSWWWQCPKLFTSFHPSLGRCCRGYMTKYFQLNPRGNCMCSCRHPAGGPLWHNPLAESSLLDIGCLLLWVLWFGISVQLKGLDWVVSYLNQFMIICLLISV